MSECHAANRAGGSLLRRRFSSPLIRNVLAMASGTAAGQAVVVAFSPLITRIYGPEAFGVQGVFLALVSVLAPAIALRYPMAIVVAESEGEAARLARLSLLIAFGLSCVLGLMLLLASGPILTALGAETLGALIWFLPLALFAVALQSVANFRTARAGSFRLIAKVKVAQAFMMNLARVLGGLATPVAAVLVAVTSVAPAVEAALLTRGGRRRHSSAPLLQRGEAMALLRRHRDFPLYRVPTDVVNAASQSVPVILLAALFSPAAAGLYALTHSVLQLPTKLIGVAVGNVFYPRFAELDRQGQPLAPLVLKATFALSLLVPIIIGAAWFAPDAFAFAFGDEWREAGHYARWMAIWTSVGLMNIPAVRVAAVAGLQRRLLLAQVGLLVVRIAAFWGAVSIGVGARGAVAAFSILSCVVNISLIVAIILPVLARDAKRKSRIS